MFYVIYHPKNTSLRWPQYVAKTYRRQPSLYYNKVTNLYMHLLVLLLIMTTHVHLVQTIKTHGALPPLSPVT